MQKSSLGLDDAQENLISESVEAFLEWYLSFLLCLAANRFINQHAFLYQFILRYNQLDYFDSSLAVWVIVQPVGVNSNHTSTLLLNGLYYKWFHLEHYCYLSSQVSEIKMDLMHQWCLHHLLLVEG